MTTNVIAFPQPKQSFVFIHRHLEHCNFYRTASKYYEAVLDLELILGPHQLWIADYICISNGKVIQPIVAKLG